MGFDLDSQFALDFRFKLVTRVSKCSFQLSQLVDLKLQVYLDGVEQIQGVFLAGLLHFI